MMWKVAVSMPCSTAQDTVRSRTSGRSPSMPNTNLALTMTPRSCSRRTTAEQSRPMFCRLRWPARLSRLIVSKPTKRLRRPAATACSGRPGASTESTVPAACHTRPVPAIPAKSTSAKRGLPKRWSSRTYRCRPGNRSISANAASTACVQKDRPPAKEASLQQKSQWCGQPRDTTIELGTRYRCRLIRSRRTGGNALSVRSVETHRARWP